MKRHGEKTSGERMKDEKTSGKRKRSGKKREEPILCCLVGKIERTAIAAVAESGAKDRPENGTKRRAEDRPENGTKRGAENRPERSARPICALFSMRRPELVPIGRLPEEGDRAIAVSPSAAARFNDFYQTLYRAALARLPRQFPDGRQGSLIRFEVECRPRIEARASKNPNPCEDQRAEPRKSKSTEPRKDKNADSCKGKSAESCEGIRTDPCAISRGEEGGLSVERSERFFRAGRLLWTRTVVDRFSLPDLFLLPPPRRAKRKANVKSG